MLTWTTWHGASQSPRHATRLRGVSLIEIVVALAIIAISIMLAVPSVSGYFQSAKLRSTAQSFFSGAEAARALAIQRNASVQFVLSSAAVTAANVDSVPLDAAGLNWAVRVVPVAPATTFELAEARPAAEGNSTGIVVASNQTSVTFNSLGMAGTGMTIDFSNPNGGACAPTGPMRCLRLVVSAGGQVRLCDPQAGASDSRRC